MPTIHDMTDLDHDMEMFDANPRDEVAVCHHCGALVDRDGLSIETRRHCWFCEEG